MLDTTQLKDEDVWKIVKDIRKSFLANQNESDCKSLLSISKTQENINNFEQKLNLLSTPTTPKMNISTKTSQIGAEMFGYLNLCPPFELLQFYQNELLVDNSPIHHITLALSSIMKTTENAEHRSSRRLLEKLLKLINLQTYKYFERMNDVELNLNHTIDLKILGLH